MPWWSLRRPNCGVAEECGAGFVGRIEQLDGEFVEGDIARRPEGRQRGEQRKTLSAADIEHQRNEERWVVVGRALSGGQVGDAPVVSYFRVKGPQRRVAG